MTTGKKPRYVPGTGGVRVTLTHELPMGPRQRFPYFLGEHDGTPIRYYCLAVAYVVAIRRGLAENGSVLHDASTSWLDLATAEDLESVRALTADEVDVLTEKLESIALTSALGDDLAALNEHARTELG